LSGPEPEHLGLQPFAGLNCKTKPGPEPEQLGLQPLPGLNLNNGACNPFPGLNLNNWAFPGMNLNSWACNTPARWHARSAAIHIQVHE
jgi:hypothetical protein